MRILGQSDEFQEGVGKFAQAAISIAFRQRIRRADGRPSLEEGDVHVLVGLNRSLGDDFAALPIHRHGTAQSASVLENVRCSDDAANAAIVGEQPALGKLAAVLLDSHGFRLQRAGDEAQRY